jgi:hypothetical protein
MTLLVCFCSIQRPHRASRLDGARVARLRQPRSACGAGLLFDRVEDSVVVVLLLDMVEELVSLLVAGALVCALGLELVSVLVPEVWAIDTPPAMAAATARVVSAFLVAFISVTPRSRCPGGTLQVGRKTPAGASWFSI